MTVKIRKITTDQQIQACFDVMVQLRPHLRRDTFVACVRRQEKTGYRMVAALDGRRVCGVAGYRVFECLSRGRNLYVDDLVTDAARRSRGIGQTMLRWLVGEALRQHCRHLSLDSGVQRFGAHRFYLREGMHILCHHFAMELGPQDIDLDQRVPTTGRWQAIEKAARKPASGRSAAKQKELAVSGRASRRYTRPPPTA
jgi:GNAT superfamily N-acetyltransferase